MNGARVRHCVRPAADPFARILSAHGKLAAWNPDHALRRPARSGLRLEVGHGEVAITG